MRIEPLLGESSCLVLRDVPDRAAILRELARAAALVLERPDHMDILAGLEARESTVATTTPEGIAFPHTVIPGLQRVALIIASIQPGVRFRPHDTAPTRIAFCIVGAREKPFEHVRLLARLARIARTPEARDRFATAPDAPSLRAALLREDQNHA